jgi:hypothetical protein
MERGSKGTGKSNPSAGRDHLALVDLGGLGMSSAAFSTTHALASSLEAIASSSFSKTDIETISLSPESTQ